MRDNFDAILVSDIHLRENKPICRTDDWENVMRSKLSFLKKYSEKYDIPVICSGDLFHKWDSSPWLISFALENLPDNMIVIAGNHDIPRHNPELIKWSALFTLEKAGKIKLLNEGENYIYKNKFQIIPFPFGSNIKTPILENDLPVIIVVHKFVYSQDCEEWEKSAGTSADILLRTLTERSDVGGRNKAVVLVGDNHKSFQIINGKGDILINPGSVFRMTVSQRNFKPRFYLWKMDGEIKRIYFPIEENVISDEHLGKGDDFTDEKMISFLDRLNENIEIDLSFKHNLRQYLNHNNIKIGVQEKIWMATN